MLKPVITFLPYQKAWINDKSRYKIGMFTRRGGKTFGASGEIVDDCIDAEIEGHKTRWTILSRSESTAKEAIEGALKPMVKAYYAAYSTLARKGRPASGYVAGLISKRDQEKGFWWSPSNQIVNGISGTARPVSFVISSTETEANRLNEAEVATIVQQDGFRLWGNRSTATDPLWTFLSVRRTADMVYESIEAAHLWAMDRPFSGQLLLDIRDSVQGYLNSLTARGALLGGRVWLDPELNTEVELKAGKLYLDFDIEPPAALEHLTFRAHRNGSYYEELVADVASVA